MKLTHISVILLWILLSSAGHLSASYPVFRSQDAHGIQKIKNVVIYKDSLFYCSFPSVTKLKNGELLVAFRRAPDRRIFGEKGNSHVDPNSYLMTIRSHNAGSWTEAPRLLYAHPFGGSQDPCLLQLHDRTLLCASYGWAFVRPDGISKLKKPYVENGGAIFLGGYLVRSEDNGKTWSEPVYPPHVPSETNFNPLGQPIPAFNRGALCEGKNRRIFWAVAAPDTGIQKKTAVHLLTSDDKGLHWKYSGIIAADNQVTFNETSLYETPQGDIVAFMRTANFDDQACIARSTDGGKTFGKWQTMGFQGHPLNALRLPDNRVLLTYGYRHQPFGIRARVLNAECTDFATAPEIILREDGGNSDLGYTWPVLVDKNTVLVVYYFNKDNGARYIAGTILKIS